MSITFDYDLAVIGSGPGGQRAAVAPVVDMQVSGAQSRMNLYCAGRHVP
jgi:hypothetical protein